MEEEVFSGGTCEDEGCGGRSFGFVDREGKSEEMMGRSGFVFSCFCDFDFIRTFI